ncbi:inorganic phosphate transporter [Planosporangium flavigriseum]|uniref:Phosphate transporter n=1 Tax=Planosporangium flavigriseum TaxID=373681 RepID=A0A8J3LSG2_9ACTN|nr:inorganic phosphate transporter [Planosporangium flavigriseum]NJC62995.1 inorganic phosphate transporter [Planosporangium flavigriseum]GIG73134.1 inorganic phosphate transporter [Planosporangium flavigriseum]
MSLMLAATIGVVVLALVFDYTNGFHDSANSISTVVATGVLRPRWAVAWAALFNFIAFLFFGTAVANTIGQTVKLGVAGTAVVFSALLGAVTWNYLSWWMGLPTSSSHALIGGLVGAGIAAGGLSAIHWGSVRKAALFMVISPLAGLILAVLLVLMVQGILRVTRSDGSGRPIKGLQLLSSAAVSLGHGTNDAQKTMGVIVALLIANGYLHQSGDKLRIPLWVVLAAHAAIAAGTLSGGWRIVRTLGTRITRLRPADGFAAEASAATALFTSTALGAPVSTTHTVAGAVTGVGVAKGAVRWNTFGAMAVAWVATIPAAAVASAAVYGLVRLPGPVSAISVFAVLAALAAAITAATRRTLRAADLEREISETGRRSAPTATPV